MRVADWQEFKFKQKGGTEALKGPFTCESEQSKGKKKNLKSKWSK